MHTGQWSQTIYSMKGSPQHLSPPRHLKSRHPFVPSAREILKQCSELNLSTARWADYVWSRDWEANSSRLHDFIPNVRFPPAGIDLPRPAWVRLNRLRTGVGRFRSSMHKWGLASSASCECGAEEQTADHVILECPIYQAPNGIHGLMSVDDETVTWLLNVCPDI